MTTALYVLILTTTMVYSCLLWSLRQTGGSSDGFHARCVIRNWMKFYNTEQPYFSLEHRTPRQASGELAPISTGHLSPTKEGLGTGLSICSCPVLKSSPMVAVAGAGRRPRSFGTMKRCRGMTASRLSPGAMAWRRICCIVGAN